MAESKRERESEMVKWTNKNLFAIVIVCAVRHSTEAFVSSSLTSARMTMVEHIAMGGESFVSFCLIFVFVIIFVYRYQWFRNISRRKKQQKMKCKLFKSNELDGGGVDKI